MEVPRSSRAAGNFGHTTPTSPALFAAHNLFFIILFSYYNSNFAAPAGMPIPPAFPQLVHVTIGDDEAASQSLSVIGRLMDQGEHDTNLSLVWRFHFKVYRLISCVLLICVLRNCARGDGDGADGPRRSTLFSQFRSARLSARMLE